MLHFFWVARVKNTPSVQSVFFYTEGGKGIAQSSEPTMRYFILESPQKNRRVGGWGGGQGTFSAEKKNVPDQFPIEFLDTKLYLSFETLNIAILRKHHEKLVVL